MRYIENKFSNIVNNTQIKRLFIYGTYINYLLFAIDLTDLFYVPVWIYSFIKNSLLYYVCIFILLMFNNNVRTPISIDKFDREVILAAGYYVLFTATVFGELEETSEKKLKKRILEFKDIIKMN